MEPTCIKAARKMLKKLTPGTTDDGKGIMLITICEDLNLSVTVQKLKQLNVKRIIIIVRKKCVENDILDYYVRS